MNRTQILRGMLGLAAAAAFSTTPALVAAWDGPTRTGASSTATPSVTCTRGSRACPIRITFAQGAYSGQAHSHLDGINARKWFVVHAQAGQAMIVIVEGAGPTSGVVHFPNGGSDGQPGGRIFDDSVPSTGDYRIRVAESQMGEGWSGGVDVVVVIY